jgi:hypothetical protein
MLVGDTVKGEAGAVMISSTPKVIVVFPSKIAPMPTHFVGASVDVTAGFVAMMSVVPDEEIAPLAGLIVKKPGQLDELVVVV